MLNLFQHPTCWVARYLDYKIMLGVSLRAALYAHTAAGLRRGAGIRCHR
ncbi:hypothetical protein [Mucilaginibacter mallensis]|nr:hypothetical protein [Mucilaginibacter mallensis]